VDDTDNINVEGGPRN